MSVSTFSEVVVEKDDIHGLDGGFLGVRRLRLRNRRSDGSSSRPYDCDFVVRPKGVDAVVVAIFRRPADAAVQVLLRWSLRPALVLGREHAPVPEPRRAWHMPEVVAGIIEAEDRGEAGVRRRAADEVHEEAGYRVDPESLISLGAGTFPTPGSMAERFWLFAVEVAQEQPPMPPAGDGSPMEQGGTTAWMPLAEAIRGCVEGRIEDAKSEIALRRLSERLASTE